MAAIAGIMVAIFCLVILFTAGRTSQSIRGGGQPSIPSPTAPTLVVGALGGAG